jgi:hypothetical protein
MISTISSIMSISSTTDTIALNTAVDSLDPTNMDTTNTDQTTMDTSNTDLTNTDEKNVDQPNTFIIIPLSNLTEEDIDIEYSLEYYKEHRTWKKCLKEFFCDFIKLIGWAILLVAVFVGVICMLIYL